MIKYRYALTKQRGIVDIHEVTPGDRKKLKPFVCLGCCGELNAVLGGQKRATKFFSHKPGAECSGESYLHRLAKQIIIHAAESGEALLLPSLEGIHSGTDLFGSEHQSTWGLPKASIEKFAAIEEQRIGNLIVDVLCITDHGEKLVVEICYSHAKDDEDLSKFTHSNLDSIEIDISDVELNVELSLLETIVLRTPHNRHWLHPRKKLGLVSESINNLKEKIETANRRKIESLRQGLNRVILNNDFTWLTVPQLEANRSKKDKLGLEIRHREVGSLAITRWAGALEEYQENIFVAAAEINEKVITPVYFAPANVLRKVRDEKPHLLVSFSDLSRGLEEAELSSEWVNISAWQDKVDDDADNAIKKKKGEYDDYIDRFRSRTTEQQVQYLCFQLGIGLPSFHCKNSKFSEAWNTTGYVWKLLVYISHLQKYDFINSGSIAKSAWLTALLKLPKDKDSVESRKIEIATWIKYRLSKVGFVAHHRGSNYDVNGDHKLRRHIDSIYEIL